MHNQICGSLDKASTGTTERTGLATTLEGVAIRFFDVVLSWHEKTRSRYDLAQLNDHMLSDIGISRATAEQESAVPFWR